MRFVWSVRCLATHGPPIVSNPASQRQPPERFQSDHQNNHSLHCTHYHRSSIPASSSLANIIPAHIHAVNHPAQPPKHAHHVGAGRPELRQCPSQEQRQILRNSPRQLHQTKHPRIRWHCKHNCLEQCADKHHGATRVQQEVCCGRRRWMWKDVSIDQLQPGSLSRGEFTLRQSPADYSRTKR